MLTTRTTPDQLVGMWSMLSEQLGEVPKRLLWDNETGIGGCGRPHALSWVSAARVIDAAHVESAAPLRAAFQQPRTTEDPLRRDLAD